MRIAVVAAGYVGLSSALVWSDLGHKVRVLDRDADRIAMLRRGEEPLALAAFSLEEGYDFTVLRAVIEQNNLQLPRFFRMMERELSGHPEPRIALLGLAFKNGTADCRESPAVSLARLMAEREWRIAAYDPAVHDRVPELPASVSIAEDIESAVAGADAIVVATEWPEFARADLDRLRMLMRGNLIFDGRCVIDPARAKAAGLRYLGICAPAP